MNTERSCKLEEIFRLQRELNDATFAKQQERDHPYFPSFEGTSPRVEDAYSFSDVCALPWHHPLRQYWIGKFMQACFSEIGEMHETTAWKWWRPIGAVVGVELKAASEEAMESQEKARRTLQNARVESIDAFHFLVSLFMLMGMNAEDMFNVYIGKHKVNHKRQDSGYLEKTEDDLHVVANGESS